MANYINKKIKVIFYDGVNHVSTKFGVCTHSDELDLILDNKDIIPRNKLIRAEILEE